MIKLRYTIALFAMSALLGGIGASATASASGSIADVGVSANPPASSPSVPVTYTATVSDPTNTTAPTGTVDFSYQTTGPGGAVTYNLGTVLLQPASASSSVAVVTITPDAPPVTVNGGNPLPNGVIVVTAAYSGDANFAADGSATNEITRADCDTGAWPPTVNGYPRSVAGGPEGYYIGEVGGWWSIYASHPEDGTTVKFSGTVTTNDNGELLDVSPTKNETGDTVRLDGQSEVTFKFLNHESLDGFTFFAGCASKVEFTDLDANGVAVPKSEINLGNPTTTAATETIKLKRTD